MAIEVLAFDLGRVIVNFDMDRVVSGLLRHTTVDRRRLEHVLWDTGWVRRLDTGRISTMEFHGYLCQEAAVDVSLEGFESIWCSVFDAELLTSPELLSELHSRYPMILVSNTNASHVDFIERTYGFFPSFHHKVFSHEVGSLKPDPEMFLRAIELSGRPPESVFYTDDREENVEAARRHGMCAFQFRSEADLRGHLHELGVRC